MTKEQLVSEARRLNPTERDEVAEAIWQLSAPDEFSASQILEIRRRIQSLDSGQAKLIPGPQVMQELRRRIQGSGDEL